MSGPDVSVVNAASVAASYESQLSTIGMLDNIYIIAIHLLFDLFFIMHTYHIM